MNYDVRLRREAQKNLDRLRGKGYEVVFETILSLRNNPRPESVKKLKDSGLWRIRVGDFRIVYAIDDSTDSVIVVRVTRRSEDTYKRL